jgi:hypothetical protein
MGDLKVAEYEKKWGVLPFGATYEQIEQSFCNSLYSL